MSGPAPGSIRRPIKPANGRGTGQTPLLPAGGLQGQVIAQGVMVVDILVSQPDAKYPLAQQRPKPVRDLAGLPGIIQTPHQIGQQAQPPLGQSQQADAAIGRDIPTAKIDLNTALTTGWKFDLRRGTIRHRQTPRRIRSKRLNYNALSGFGGNFL